MFSLKGTWEIHQGSNLGSGFSGEGQVPRVTWDISGWGGGPEGDRGLLCLCRGWSLLCGPGLGVFQGLRPKVGQRQRQGSNVVDPQQDLQGADLLETLICQGITGPLDLLNARGEGTDPASCKERAIRRSILGKIPQCVIIEGGPVVQVWSCRPE